MHWYSEFHQNHLSPYREILKNMKNRCYNRLTRRSRFRRKKCIDIQACTYLNYEISVVYDIVSELTKHVDTRAHAHKRTILEIYLHLDLKTCIYIENIGSNFFYDRIYYTLIPLHISKRKYKTKKMILRQRFSKLLDSIFLKKYNVINE